ncbi:MAG: Tyrosine-protein phosphatase precursor [Tenericutes bacterium ADurb.Bin087]|nr:MAG: Tyrosine-protein phosphatase precursor [Tenericutes bacterium ADurb.Bin087]
MVKQENNLFILNNLYNVRDLGHIATKYGTKTRRYKYIRGTAKGTMTEAEKAFFYNLGVRIIVDLRYTKEIDKTPSPMRDYHDIEYYHVDMMGEFWQMREQGYQDMTDLYIDLLDDSQDKLLTIFRIFLKHKNEGIYFHCTAGKDRTGVVTMLLLDLVGVPHSTIVENYSESYSNNLARPGYTSIKSEWRRFILSEPEYMERTLDHLYTKYGGSRAYLSHIGLREDEINALAATIVE